MQCSLLTVSVWACGFSAVFSVHNVNVIVWVQCNVLFTVSLWACGFSAMFCSQFHCERVGSVQCSLFIMLM